MSPITAPIVSIDESLTSIKNESFGKRKATLNRIFRIVRRRIPRVVRDRNRNNINRIAWSISVIYEDFLYKYTSDMASYSNIDTLGVRVTEAARVNRRIVIPLLCGGS